MRTVLLATVLVAAVGCKKPTPPTPVVTPQPAPKPVVEQVVERPAEDLAFQRVQFDFDASEPSSASGAALRNNVEILQKYPELRVELQGHADERGTTEYNLALGERRAYAVRDRMTSMGITESRMSVVTYGEERPRTRGSTPQAYSDNRRVEFRVLTGEKVKGTVP